MTTSGLPGALVPTITGDSERILRQELLEVLQYTKSTNETALIFGIRPSQVKDIVGTLDSQDLLEFAEDAERLKRIENTIEVFLEQTMHEWQYLDNEKRSDKNYINYLSKKTDKLIAIRAELVRNASPMQIDARQQNLTIVESAAQRLLKNKTD